MERGEAAKRSDSIVSYQLPATRVGPCSGVVGRCLANFFLHQDVGALPVYFAEWRVVGFE